MREILFRGKNESGKWVEGYYIRAVWYLDEQVTDCIFPIGTTLYPHCEHSGFESIVPETVGQYTGLTDKNGTKIFEGDIVNFKTTPYDFTKCIVEYRDYYAEYCAVDNKGFEYSMDKFCEYEVIGNIYDNPELLRSAVLRKVSMFS